MPTAVRTDHPAGSVTAALRSPKLLRTEVLAGLVVALALIPEAIAFSVIAGVDPRVGLFASFTMAITIAFTGGRRAMISAATGAVAFVVAPVVREHGLDYLLATVILAGVLQIALSVAGVAKLMRFIPRSVMVGVVNSLATLVFLAQLPQLIGVPWLVYPLVGAGMAIIALLPRITTAVPAPLVAVIALTAVTVTFGLHVPDVGGAGDLPSALPVPLLPQVPLNIETLRIIAPYSFAMAVVGLLESLMTATLVDDITDTPSNKTRESWGQGVANIVTGFFGGLGGCAVIGQTVMNVKVSGARTRISTFLAGVFLLILVVGLGGLVARIPMAALVAVMIMVSITAMDWHSLAPATLRRMPIAETTVMLLTVGVTVVTHNLAYGVVTGVITAMVAFAHRVAHFTEVVPADPDDATRVYKVRGELFFASSNDLVHRFDYSGDPPNIVLDMSETHIWDASTVAALDAITTKYAAQGKRVEILGLNPASVARHQRLSGHLTGGH
ncbi:SulP family inorganic anion transporter [Nocardia jinanensis]|uniref:Sodium-independent anion transporter n=1 Tax=Nocardia jinanensis TaxID=382504 RepID=A0A917RF37_9NOCA|nr:SulP family inorganic anion transporter [Nocardia jinanensis]GGL05196.1 sodium-independent anion transporter [Nocardia jinanensis]